MKYILSILLISGIALMSHTENFVVKSVDELKNDISARTNQRMDENNNPCALVRLNLPTVDNLIFGSMIVGDVTRRPGEFEIYLRPGTETLSFTCNEESYDIKFSDYDMNIQSKNTYRIILLENTPIASNESDVLITANYDNQVVLIDGIPVGETPVHLSAITLGRHNISVPNRNNITMNDTIVDIVDGVNRIELVLHEESPKPVHIEWVTPGGDSATWHIRLGVLKSTDGEKEGLVDYTGNQIVPNEFDYISLEQLPNDYIVVGKLKSKETTLVYCGLYDPINGLIIEPIYDNIYIDCYDNHSAVINVRKDKKWGVVDTSGKLIIPIEFDSHVYVNRNSRTLTARTRVVGSKFSNLFI